MSEVIIVDSDANKTIEEVKIVEAEKRPLVIFKTDADKYGRDITLMSDFFDGYVQQMALSIKDQSNLEAIQDIPVASIGIINDAIHQASVVLKGNITLLPDFDSLPVGIKDKLKKGIYTVGESKQVDGNLRAVILDEEGVRVKDITLKKVISNPGNVETTRSITYTLLEYFRLSYDPVKIIEREQYWKRCFDTIKNGYNDN